MTDDVNDVQEVRVGQTWKDWDKRVRDQNPGRLIHVDEVGETHAQCTIVASGKTTKIRLDRFRPTSKGYKLIEDVPSDEHPDPVVELLQEEIISRTERIHRRKVAKAQKRVDKLERVVDQLSRSGRRSSARKREAKLIEARRHLDDLTATVSQ